MKFSRGKNISAIFGWLIVMASLNSYYDNQWYLERVVSIPYISTVTTLVLAMGYLAFQQITRRAKVGIGAGTRGFVLFWLVAQLSVLGLIVTSPNAEQIAQFLKSDLNFLVQLCLVITITNLFTIRTAYSALRFYFVVGTVLAVFGFVQFVHVNLVTIPWMENLLFGTLSMTEEGLWIRVASVFNEPSYYGWYLIDWIAIGFALYVCEGKVTYLIATSVLVGALLISASFAGLISLVVMVAGFLVAFKGIRTKTVVIVIIGLALITLSFLAMDFFREKIVARIGTVWEGSDGSVEMRLDSTFAALRVWLEHPVFGVGLGNTRFFASEFYTSPMWLLIASVADVKTNLACDCYYATLLAELGIVGAIGFVVAFAGLFRGLSRLDEQLISAWPSENSGMSRSSKWGGDKLSVMRKAFAVIIFVCLVQFIYSGGFLLPRIWINIGLFLVFKDGNMMELTQFRNAVKRKLISKAPGLMMSGQGS